MLAKKVFNRISWLSFSSPWFILSLFSLLGLIGILNHSMWRDELNPWLIVRDSKSFADLIANIRYEGHPVLWYFSLAFVRKIADNPVTMQIFHWLITVISVGFLFFYSPFNYKQKILFVFGYFPFYEYYLISRNYAFSMLFIFAFCSVFTSRKKTYIYLAVLLGLLANSSAYALIVSFCLLLTLMIEFSLDHEHRHQYFRASKNMIYFESFDYCLFFYPGNFYNYSSGR